MLAASVVGAHAQSSVTLCGIVDAGISYFSNTATQGRVDFGSGDAFGDRWGMKGNEDLGGGRSAIFQLENGFNIGTGAFGASG